MLFRAPNAAERQQSTRSKILMSARFSQFWSGSFEELINSIFLSTTEQLVVDGLRVPRTIPTSDEEAEELIMKRSQKFAKKDLISKASKTLESSPSTRGS